MHNIQMITVIVGCTLSFIGILIVFLLGIITNYIRENAKNTRDILVILSEHKVKIENHGKDIQTLFDFYNKNK